MAEVVVALLAVEREPRAFVDPPGLHEHVVGPEADPLIARAPCGPQAFIDEASPDAAAARPRLDQQEPELRGALVISYAEDAARALPVVGFVKESDLWVYRAPLPLAA